MLNRNIEIEIIVIEDINISGKINELNIEIGKISVNEANSEFKSEYTNKLIPLFSSSLNEYIAKNIKFEFPMFIKNIRIEHKSSYLALYYTFKKEIFHSYLNNYINRFESSLKGLYFKADYSSHNTAATNINKILLDIFNEFIKDDNLRTQFNTITQTILKIPDTINDQNKRNNIFNELKNEISKIDSNFAFAANEVKYFIEQSVGMAQAPESVQKSQLINILNDFSARDVCLFDEALIKLVRRNKDYFIYYQFDYSECYRMRNPK